MSTQNPWQSAQQKPDSSVARTEEEITSPGKPVSRLLIAAVALLVGLGLGHLVSGATADDLRTTQTKLTTATGRLTLAEQKLASATLSVKRLSTEEVDRDALVTTLGRVIDSSPRSFARAGGAVDAQVTDLIRARLSAINAWHLSSYISLYSRDAKFALYLGDSAKREWTGHKAIRNALQQLGPPHLRQASPAVQQGELVWYRYVEDESSGVQIMQVRDGKVRRDWVVITRPGRP